MTGDEVLGELRAGRLKAWAEAGTGVMMQRFPGGVDSDMFFITAQTVFEWLENPKTPKRLKKKLHRSLNDPKLFDLHRGPNKPQ
jgi:hypothetical protein